MASRDLEFRGINRRHLEMYFEELGGKRLAKESRRESEQVPASQTKDTDTDSDSFPSIFVAAGWEGQILSEQEISFTSIFKVNAVMVRFTADDEVGLEELIKKYRYKTTRVGAE